MSGELTIMEDKSMSKEPAYQPVTQDELCFKKELIMLKSGSDIDLAQIWAYVAHAKGADGPALGLAYNRPYIPGKESKCWVITHIGSGFPLAIPEPEWSDFQGFSTRQQVHYVILELLQIHDWRKARGSLSFSLLPRIRGIYYEAVNGAGLDKVNVF
jgi:hypothetical protein